MKTYTVLYAEDVPHYGFETIEAKDDAAAVEKAKTLDFSGTATDPEYNSAKCCRIVHIEREDGAIAGEDIDLDDFFLAAGGQAARHLNDAAKDLLAALEAQEMAEADPEASRRKGYFDRARDMRRAAIAKAKGGAK